MRPQAPQLVSTPLSPSPLRSEGWAVGLQVLADHYGLDERKDLTALFIAVVPVSFDVVFKYWCYSSLRNYSPDTQIILDEIDH